MIRIGVGYDAHKFTHDRKLILGGVLIPFSMGLAGHSDADVLLHAVADSLLGALALGDIGKHYSDKDQQYKGISSLVLLEKTAGIVHSSGWKVGNIDSVLVLQEPKIAPFVEQMRINISGAVDIDVSLVSVKATTTEKMGFEGRGEGISAQAVCTLLKSTS